MGFFGNNRKKFNTNFHFWNPFISGLIYLTELLVNGHYTRYMLELLPALLPVNILVSRAQNFFFFCKLTLLPINNVSHPENEAHKILLRRCPCAFTK